MKIKHVLLCLTFITVAFMAGIFSNGLELNKMKIENDRVNKLLKTANC